MVDGTTLVRPALIPSEGGASITPYLPLGSNSESSHQLTMNL
jgi:hypothetical protein